MNYKLYPIILMVIIFSIPVFGDEADGPLIGNRKPQWPLKTARTLFTDQQIARARQLCESNKDAMALQRSIMSKAEYWVKKSDKQLRELLPDARVPRAFNVSTEGCPVHGKAIYKGGCYPWKLDRERPFTIICPEGGERYPSNDFETYYRTGMKDKSLLTGDYADSGRGWAAANGEKYWLIGYACHWNWQNNWLPAVDNLSRAYLLTGKRIYARKAIVMLDRIAEIYPGMDYSKQSRYAELRNGHYYGKILNSIWETWTLRNLAMSYDMIFDTLIGKDAISLSWRRSEEIRANIESNLLEEGLDAIAHSPSHIQGNFGMHQCALAYTAVVRQNGPMRELLDGLFTQTGSGNIYQDGFNYALYNLVFKDGMPIETSPSYCSLWINSFLIMYRPLLLGGFDLYQQPKLQRMFDAPIEMICAGRFTPAVGDAGSITTNWILPSSEVYEQAYRRLREPRYAWALKCMGSLKKKTVKSIEDLIEEPIYEAAVEDLEKYNRQPKSRLLDGYGLVILNNPRNTCAVSMYYGLRGGHGHKDRLNIEIFAHNRRMTPDLGYPDFMNAYVPGIYSWSKNTISHNTLAIDRKTQSENITGKVLRFHDSPTVHVVDVEAAGTYKQADTYRRTLVMVDVGGDDLYLVDVFRVRGGKDHVLSIHGNGGEFTLQGAILPPPVTEGTLAGHDVAYGQLYDDPVLGKTDYKGMYSHYKGSGYQHFFNSQRVTTNKKVIGNWKLKGKQPVQLRVHVPPHPGQELIVADAYVSPTQQIPTVLKYMLVKRRADESGNCFIAVWEPAENKPIIDRVEIHEDLSQGIGHDRLVVLSVHRGDTLDTIAVAPEAGHEYALGQRKSSDAAVVVISERKGKRIRTFAAGGSKLISDQSNQTVKIPSTITGIISSIDYTDKAIYIENINTTSDVDALPGKVVKIFNNLHTCMYRISAAEEHNQILKLKLTGSDIFTGKVKIKSIDPKLKRVYTKTEVLYPFNNKGMRLVTEDMKHAARIEAITNGSIHLSQDAQIKPFGMGLDEKNGKDAWIVDFGVGDRIEIERFVYNSSF